MAYSTVPKTLRDGIIVLLDGTGSPVECVVAYEEGNMTFDNLTNAEEQTVFYDRGAICSVRKGNDTIISGSFNFYFREFTSSSVGGVRDFITGSNAYSANISTGATGVPYVEHFCVDIRYMCEGTDVGDSKDHTATMSRCVANLSFAEGSQDVWSLSFSCYGGITVT